MDNPRHFQPRPPPAPASGPGKSKVDYEHRTTVNLMAVIAIILLAAGLYWTAHNISESRKLERCVSSGRRDCFLAPDPSPKIVPAARTAF